VEEFLFCDEIKWRANRKRRKCLCLKRWSDLASIYRSAIKSQTFQYKLKHFFKILQIHQCYSLSTIFLFSIVILGEKKCKGV